MFAPAFDHSFNDLFNQYVNMDPAASGDGNKDVGPFTGDLDQLFLPGSLSSDCGDLSPIGSSSQQLAQSPLQSWQKRPWCMQQDDVAPSRTGAFQDTVQPSAISDISLNPEDPLPPSLGLLSTSPSTPPVTPNRKASSQSAIITPKSISRREPNDRRALLRKHSFSPSLMRSSHLQKTKMAYPEAWTQRLQNYANLRGATEDRLPLSPPPSDILVQHENMRRDSGVHMSLSTSGSSGSEGLEMPSQYSSPMFHQPSSGNPLAKQQQQQQQQQQGYLSQSNSAAVATSSPHSADDLFHTSHSSESQQIPAWHADALGASGVSFTPDINGHDSQSWWSSPMPTRVSHATSQHPYQPMILPEKPTIHSLPHQNDLLQGGLMIQFGSPFDLGSAAPESSFSSASALDSTSAPHIPAAQPQAAFSSASSFMTPSNAQPAQQPQSRSPSMSPTATTSPKSAAARAGKTNNHRRTHSRKLSGQSTTAPKPATKLGGSPKGANKTMSVSFVNFTPEDSHKILTGVAPSGSSKTKARREQEAREKRRKISEAALMAVRKAGGDVEALEAVLC
ncbi:hypothetical protein VTN96DRAFT_5225 [Rasamsonia emersonii]|uniref:Developmental regulatory protein wetA n=1 Tax=Rasamsonia emersonii (strain ATCC 16479 / CBS 393.64 / IMI 116815) TaxID=1408163 RepID=A0A0F4YP86_RASE3|nr:Developmental regulatory protein WetA [Rasamsonia emersonii CBS 393.64]KKA19910.1 Developmental regulatory protein WetA [Rasamsonia emersonii CBS 393.64]